MKFCLTWDNWVVLVSGGEAICKMSLYNFEQNFGFRRASELVREFR